MQLDLQEPALARRVLVDQRRARPSELAVDLDDLAGDGRIDLARRLDAFDHRRLAALASVLPTSGSSTKTTSPSWACA